MEISKGDIFLCGKHRIMCGNSLSLTDVNKLLDGQRADMIFMDPPYSVNYIPEDRRKGGRSVRKLGGIIGDIDFKVTQLLDLINTGIVKGAVYMCCGTNQIEEIYPWVQKHLEYRPTFIMWVKNGFSILARDYHSAYEPVLYFYYPEKKFRGSRGQTDVWFIKRRATGKYVHPTQKPVALIQRAIENSSDEGDIVLDLFGGSGSTLIACENTNRRCFMNEIDPKFVLTIIERFEALTGLKAVKLTNEKQAEPSQNEGVIIGIETNGKVEEITRLEANQEVSSVNRDTEIGVNKGEK
jgi:DNA modification methylase